MLAQGQTWCPGVTSGAGQAVTAASDGSWGTVAALGLAVSQVELPEEGSVSRNGALRRFSDLEAPVAARDEALAEEARPASERASLPPRCSAWPRRVKPT